MGELSWASACLANIYLLGNIYHPPSYHQSPYDPHPISYHDPCPPYYDPRPPYYDPRLNFFNEPPTSSGTWHDGSSTNAHHDFNPIPRPHQPWPPTPHRMSVEVPCSTLEAPHTTDQSQHSTDEACHRNHRWSLPSAVVQGARKPFSPMSPMDFLEMDF
ncbi:unnamed protein product [Linum trigynum]|uniref:Uncharacterized protein n=1 Tax=Linum trigynum TaxID=586398 RepID=A0AAV2DZB1_9ROSI